MLLDIEINFCILLRVGDSLLYHHHYVGILSLLIKTFLKWTGKFI